MSSDVLLLFILLSLLVAAYAAVHKDDNGSVRLDVFFFKLLRIDFRTNQNRANDKQQPEKSINVRDKNRRYIDCRYCNQSIKKTRIQRHNKVCPQRPRNIRSKRVRFSRKNNTPFD